jgi:crotonobetainyl-CoA:carnitine CoA-transferase CaiB-like acyl-CoA transferase
MAPPLLGEHTHDLLCNLLGMSEQEVLALQQAGVV